MCISRLRCPSPLHLVCLPFSPLHLLCRSRDGLTLLCCSLDGGEVAVIFQPSKYHALTLLTLALTLTRVAALLTHTHLLLIAPTHMGLTLTPYASVLADIL